MAVDRHGATPDGVFGGHAWHRPATDLRTDDFDYDLPADLVAQVPADPRDASRPLLRAHGSLQLALLSADAETTRLAQKLGQDLAQTLRDQGAQAIIDAPVFRA